VSVGTDLIPPLMVRERVEHVDGPAGAGRAGMPVASSVAALAAIEAWYQP
jgi:hypothetical protein